MLQEKLAKRAGPARAPCASGKPRQRGPNLHTLKQPLPSCLVFPFAHFCPFARNHCLFLLPIQEPHPDNSPSWHQRPIAYLERNSPGSKRAQAVVYRVLYTMNLFAFANSLKIVPPLIVIEGSGETGENNFWPRELPTPQIVRTEESTCSSQPQSWDSGSGLKCLFNYVHKFILFTATDIPIYMSYSVYNESIYKSLLIHVP